MTAEEFHKETVNLDLDKFDKKAPKFDYYDLIDFAESYHKKQLTLTDVGCSWPSKEEVNSKLRQLHKRWGLSENEDEKQAFNHGFKSCVRWIKEQSE